MTTTCGSMDTMDEARVVIEALNPDWYEGYVQQVSMLRLDMLHPVISGNKWYKLKHNIKLAQQQECNTLLTFGGAYSNHLVATAAAAQVAGMNSIGVVRGGYAEANLTPTLVHCKEYSMQLVFVSREEYAQKFDAEYLQSLSEKYNHPYIIPEGGANVSGSKGCEEIGQMIGGDYSHICVSVGTGTTFSGMRAKLPCNQYILGFVPMKGGSYVLDEINSLLPKAKQCSLRLFDKWHFGGFGKYNDELLDFMNGFYEHNSIPLDFVYTAKMMYGVKELIKEGFFTEDSHILCVHTGGLQGNRSIEGKLTYGNA